MTDPFPEYQKPDIKRCALFILPLWALVSVLAAAVLGAPVFTGTLPGPDDYMRMVRIMDLLDGGTAGPFLQPRLGPEGGAILHWSRLADWPLYIWVRLFEPFAGRAQAAMIAASILPPLQLLAAAFAACWAAAPVTGGRRAVLALPLLFLMGPVIYQYMPGKIDHHGWQALLTIIAYGGLARLYRNGDVRRPMIIAGAACAFGMAIGAEIVPWVALACGFTALMWVTEGTPMRRAGIYFSATLAGTTLMLFMALRPWDATFLTPDCDMLSVSYVALAVAAFLFWAAIWFVPEKTGACGRFGFAALCGAILLAGIYMTFPACFHDPYGINAPALREIWLSHVREAQPAWDYAPGKPVMFVVYALPVLLGLLSALCAAKKEPDRRSFWIVYSIILLAGFALSLLQIRIFILSQAVALVPLAWGLSGLVRKAGGVPRNIRLAGEALFLVACIGLFASSTGKKEPVGNGETGSPRALPCDERQTAALLNTIETPMTVAANINEGSEFIFRTHHRFLAAPYHRDGDGILAAHNILARPASEARKIVDEYHVGAIVVCGAEEAYWQAFDDHALAADLIQRKTPDWLIPVEGQSGGYLVFRVKN